MVGDHEATLGVLHSYHTSVNVSTIYERYSINMIILSRLVSLSLARYSSKEKADDIIAFFKDKDIKGFDRGLQQVIHLNLSTDL